MTRRFDIKFRVSCGAQAMMKFWKNNRQFEGRGVLRKERRMRTMMEFEKNGFKGEREREQARKWLSIQ
jgi:hypothetical protein